MNARSNASKCFTRVLQSYTVFHRFAVCQTILSAGLVNSSLLQVRHVTKGMYNFKVKQGVHCSNLPLVCFEMLLALLNQYV